MTQAAAPPDPSPPSSPDPAADRPLAELRPPPRAGRPHRRPCCDVSPTSSWTPSPRLQNEIFVDLPNSLGFHGEPLWWPLPWLASAGSWSRRPFGTCPEPGGHEPSEGFKSGGPVQPVELFGIVAAAFATLSLGAVLGPEAPLIAIGSGLGVLAVHLFKRDAPPMAVVVIGVAGSFAAIATLLGSPLVGAFLLMEMAGLGGPMMELVLVPGLLSAGVGALIFVGLDNLTGFGTFSLTVGPLPHVGSPTGSEFLWAIVIGLGSALRRHRHLQARIIAAPARCSGGASCSPRWPAWRSADWPSPSPPGRRTALRRCCSRARRALPALVQQAAGWTVGALRPAHRLQGTGLRHLAEWVSGRSDLPEHVHRRGRRHRTVPRRRAADGRRRGHGRRGDGGRRAARCP